MIKPSNTEINAVEGGMLELLQTEMEKGLNETDFSDLDVECGGSTLKCHKAILSARSTTFKQLIGSAPNSSKLVIEDINLEVLQVSYYARILAICITYSILFDTFDISKCQ